MEYRIIGGIVSVGVLFWYARQIWSNATAMPNPASWVMWFVLDSLLFTTTYLADQPIWLPLAYVVGAGTVVISIFFHPEKSVTWSWKYTETLSLIAAVIATTVWLSSNASFGVVAAMTAMLSAGIPVYKDMVVKPVRETFPVWFFTAVACVFTLLGSDWTFTGTVVGWAGLAYNGSLSLVVLRKR